MNTIFSMTVPLLITAAAAAGLGRGLNIYGIFTAGALEGLKTVVKIFPALVGLMTVVYMLRASGALEALAKLLEPMLTILGMPAEVVPLMLVRPVSGSGALAVASDIIKTYGADSLIGRTAAVMIGSTETTFYTIAVYFGAAGVKKTRYAVPAAVIADCVGFFAAALAVRLIFF